MTPFQGVLQRVCRLRTPWLHAPLQRMGFKNVQPYSYAGWGGGFSLDKRKRGKKGKGRERREKPPHPVRLQSCKRDMKPPMQLTAPTPTARARRRLARRMSTVATWWASLPYPKPTALTPTTLQRISGIDMQRLAPALHALGWQRILRRVHGKPTTLWLPPGSPVTRRPRGRPRLHTLIQPH